MRMSNGFGSFDFTLCHGCTRPKPPNVTHAQISQVFCLPTPGLAAPMFASMRFVPPVPDRQTLRVCSEIVRGPFDHASHTACRLAKRYVCASSALLDAGTCRDSSIRTRQRPPNVTHTMLFAFQHRFRETLHTCWFPRLMPRRMHLFGPLRAPNLHGRRVW